MINYFRTHKISLFLILVFLIQTFFSFYQNRSLFRSFQSLDTKIGSLDQKVTKLAPSANDSVITALGQLREELVKYRAEQMGRDQILGVMSDSSLSSTLDRAIATINSQVEGITPTPATIKSASLKPGWKSIDAFEKPLASSKIIGQIIANEKYPILNLQNNWYQLTIASGQSAYVQTQFIDETTN